MKRLHTRGGRFDSEDVNPMNYISNLSDAMLILAVGIMLALIVHWNVDISTSGGTMSDSGTTYAADGSVLVDGQCSFYDFLAHFGLEDVYSSAEYNTISGLILDELEHIPHSGEYLQWECFRLEVVDMDGARIDKVLATMIDTSDNKNK